YPKPDLHVRSNSRVALERVLSVMLGRPHQSQDLVRLSDTDEFKYIRTLMPIDAQEEDGIIYLSDPFIRNVVGPTQKLTQRSRLMCNSQLQLIAYASLLYQTQFGKKASSLEQLQARGCLGTAEAPLELRCPDGGEFTLHEDGIRGVCTHHGCLHSLLPCCEIPRQKITEEEAADYQMFVQDYNRFWTTFFDPIVIRVQQSKQRTRVETIVLPLISNSVYRGLASTLGGATEDLDTLPIASSNIFSVAARLDKEQLLSQFAIPRPKKSVVESVDEPADLARKQLERAVQNLQMLALAMHNFESANRHFPPKPLDRSSSKASGLSWRVDVLPYLENGVQLYNQFHHDEPWDSAHNRKLISQMPEQFFGTNAELNKEGKTQFLRPFHAKAAHYSKTRGTKFGEITDGTSNTIMAVVADEERAVIWTKPDDISIDMARPREGWNSGVSGTVLAAKMDGSVFELPSTATDDQVRALLTRNGGEFIEIVLPRMTANNMRPRNLLSRLEGYEELGLPEFLYDGIGSQVGIHVCDTDPLIDFNVARFLGMVGGSFDGRNPMMFSQTGMFALLAVSMNAPVYISVPLEDSEIADNFLERLDRFLVRMSREFSQSASPFFEIAQEVYTFADDGQTGNSVRAYAFRFGPLTWRFYWTRIGNGLYIASKPHLIGEVRNATKTRPSETDEVTRLSHGLIRVRPGNWKRVKSHYAVGWAESERRACSNNMGTLADVARAVYHDEHSDWSEVETRVLRTNHMQPFCPCNGKYSFDATNVEIHCSVHGSLESPKQPVGAIGSRLTELTSTLRDVFLELNFLEDGLHAIVTVERE
ncbi:MAG: DUF1559 domain-containing protein, partial [bacterium]|nr:DUF1559 domain-containing protein [bacterium]